MTGKMWFIALTLFATACTAARADNNAAQPSHAEQICKDPSVHEALWDKKEEGCRAHFQQCMPTLTPAQRTTWEQQVGKCLETKSVYDCYASAPWC